MSHYASKLLSFAWEPLAWLAFFVALSTLLLLLKRERARVWGVRLLVASLLSFGVLSWNGLPEHLIANMEQQAQAPSDLSTYHGMIVLGGAIASPRIRANALPPLACSGERIIEPIALMNQYPHLKLLFTGGDARLTSDPAPESDDARQYFERFGVDMSRVAFESNSRNTYENAVRSRDVPGIDPAKSWLLVTSAWHMPRALASFQHAGWNVTPYPVDYYAAADVSLDKFSLSEGVNSWRLLLREKLGMLVYWALGRV